MFRPQVSSSGRKIKVSSTLMGQQLLGPVTGLARVVTAVRQQVIAPVEPAPVEPVPDPPPTQFHVQTLPPQSPLDPLPPQSLVDAPPTKKALLSLLFKEQVTAKQKRWQMQNFDVGCECDDPSSSSLATLLWTVFLKPKDNNVSLGKTAKKKC